MKKILLTAAAVLLSSAAFAQVPPPPPPGWNGGPPPPPPPGAGPGWHRGPGGWDANAFWRGAPDNPRDRIDFLQQRVDRGRADGSLDWHEAGRISGELNGLRHWIHHQHWEDQGPLTPDQRYRVQARLDQISQQIRWAHHHDW